MIIMWKHNNDYDDYYDYIIITWLLWLLCDFRIFKIIISNSTGNIILNINNNYYKFLTKIKFIKWEGILMFDLSRSSPTKYYTIELF